MSDPKQPDRPPGDGADPGGMSEAELDSMLANASGLVSELTRQVGEPDATGAPAPALTSPDPVKAVVGDKELDAELAKLDTLLSSAADDVGANPSPTSSTSGDGGVPTPSPSAPAPSKSAPRDIPDFMQEFTQPDAAPSRSTPPKPSAPASEPQKPTTPRSVNVEPVAKTAAKNASADSTTAEPAPTVRAAPAGKPGVVGTGMLGVVASPVADTTLPSATESAPTNGEPAVSPPTSSEAGNPPPVARRVLKGVEPLLIKVAEKGLGVMEKADRPFARLGGSARRFLGLAALATLATALIVLFISSL